MLSVRRAAGLSLGAGPLTWGELTRTGHSQLAGANQRVRSGQPEVKGQGYRPAGLDAGGRLGGVSRSLAPVEDGCADLLLGLVVDAEVDAFAFPDHQDRGR